MLKFSDFFIQFLNWYMAVCLTRSKQRFINDSRILQKPSFTRTFIFLLLTTNNNTFFGFLITVQSTECLKPQQTNKSVDLV